MQLSEIVLPGKISDFMKVGRAAAGRGDVEAVGHILEQRPEWYEWPRRCARARTVAVHVLRATVRTPCAVSSCHAYMLGVQS